MLTNPTAPIAPGFVQSLIFVNIYFHDYNSANQKLVLSMDLNMDLTLSPYESTSQKQIWQLIPNYSDGCHNGGYTLCNYYAQQKELSTQCVYNPGVLSNPIGLGDSQSPYGEKNYCWSIITQNYSDDPNTENGIITIRDYQAKDCISATVNSSGAIIGVDLKPFANGMPSRYQLWSLTDAIPPKNLPSN